MTFYNVLAIVELNKNLIISLPFNFVTCGFGSAYETKIY